MTSKCRHVNASSATWCIHTCVWTPSWLSTYYCVGTSLQKGEQLKRKPFRNSGLLNHMIKMVLSKIIQVTTLVHHHQNAIIIQHHNLPLLGHAFDVDKRWSCCRSFSTLCLCGGLWAPNLRCQRQAPVESNDKQHFGHHESCKWFDPNKSRPERNLHVMLWDHWLLKRPHRL